MKTFTASQQEAVNLDVRTIACVAGPGSGKTSVLVARVNRLIEDGCAPERIGVLTFTNAAARNLEERLGRAQEQRVGDVVTTRRLGYCGTLHAFALRTLRDHGARIGYGQRLAVLDEEAAADLLASKAKALGCKRPIKELEKLKRAGKPASLFRGGPPPNIADTVVGAYLDDLRENGLVDLDTILPELARLIPTWNGVQPEGWGFDCLLVDEVQDSSVQDWAIYNALPVWEKFYVGDPDQAIYAFRGGRQDLFLEFVRRHDVNVIRLEENFRCSPEVCAAANNLIRHNRARIPKNTFAAQANRRTGIVTRCGYETEGEEVGQVVVRIRALMTDPNPVEPDGIAILARTNAIAAPFRDALKAAGIPVAEAPRSEAPPDWSLARALVDLLAQPDNDTLAFFYVAARERRRGATAAEAAAKAHGIRLEAGKTRQTVNALWFKLPRLPALTEVGPLMEREGLTAETLAHVQAMIAALPVGSGVLELAADMGLGFFHGEQSSSGVHVGTVHAAKGREWDQVFLVGYEQEVTPGKTLMEEVEEEERRLAFVGITRARVACHFTHAAQRRATWGRQEVLNRTPSRFIEEAVQ